jgi:hypothetical protein
MNDLAKLLAILGLCLAGYLAIPTETTCQVQVIDRAGELWIAGEGDTCLEAIQGSAEHMPEDWAEISLVQN